MPPRKEDKGCPSQIAGLQVQNRFHILVDIPRHVRVVILVIGGYQSAATLTRIDPLGHLKIRISMASDHHDVRSIRSAIGWSGRENGDF